MSRGRKAIEINVNDFQNLVADIEAKQSPKNRSELWKMVEASDWAKSLKPRPLTAQVAYQKATKLNLTVNTPMGKRGEGLASARDIGAKRKRVSLDVLQPFGQNIPTQFKSTLNKMAKGSLKAALKLKCLDCSNWCKKEVRECAVKTCVLYPIRPYQS